MQFECKFNGMPVGRIETKGEIQDGVSRLSFDAYRCFAHLEMYNQFAAGIPVFIEAEIGKNLVYLELLEHNGDSIRVQKFEESIRRERRFGSMKGLVENISEDFNAPLEDFEKYM
ncbi:MAG TPA: hypothetical protein VK892_18045 [Pyrinomonadaceae bacterium]|nr:hypothetical protein [Pyrinomonadaceae bacterium]